MTEAFYSVLEASFHGSIVILAVIALRLVLRKAPRSVFCLLWLLAGLRLALPFEIESDLSLQPRLEEPEISIQADIPVQDTPITAPAADEAEPIPEQSPILPNENRENQQSGSDLYVEKDDTITSRVTFGDIATPLWLVGAGAMILASLWSYLKLKRRVREAYLIENGCFECPGLETAFVLGFLPPKIYLPAGLAEQEKKFIFDHENTHIARHDHWYKLLGYLVLALHWFNPLVWVGYSLLCRDIELACDEHVVKYMSILERKAYSAALLSCGGHTARIAACPVAFGESNPKKRILNVLNYKRPSFWISLTAIIAVAFVAVCLMTSPGKPSLLEFADVADDELHNICIGSEGGLADVSHPDDIREIQKLLDSISWEKDTPTERRDESDGYVILFNSLLAEDALYFSEDCSLVWAEGTQAYPVEDPEALREYLDSITDAVWNRETSGESFADISQPAQWLRGISESAVREAEIYVEQPTVQEGNSSTTTSSIGVLSARDFDALLDILNGLPESAIVSESTLPRETFGLIQRSLVPHGGMTLTFYDDVNQLVMLLRLVKDDVVEFILIDELDKVGDEPLYLDHPRCWILENDTLLAFLKEMQEYPLVIYPIEFFGHDTSDAEIIQRCREAMVALYSAPEQYIHVETPGDATAVVNTYYIAENGWMFTYKRPQWDYTSVRWLTYGNRHYEFKQGHDHESLLTVPYYWQEESPEEAPLQPDMDAGFWAECTLNFRSAEQENGMEIITLEMSDTGGVYTFHFLDGELLYYDRGTSRFYVVFPYDGTVAEYLDSVYAEASAQAGQKPQTPDAAFYEELFARKTDGAYTEQWIDDLFMAFYTDPTEFISRLAQSDRAEKIATHMGYSLEIYGPSLFEQCLYALEQEGGQDQQTIELLRSICSGEYYDQQAQSQERIYASAQLSKCREALAEYQSQGSWAIQTENSFSGSGATNSSSVSQWFGCGGDFMTWTQIPDDGGTHIWWDMKVDGISYHRSAYDPTESAGAWAEEPDPWDSGWETGSTNGEIISPVWPLWFDWAGADIEFEEAGADDSSEYVKFTVQGSPFEAEPFQITEYEVTCWFQDDVLWKIDVSYTSRDSWGDTYGKKTFDLYAFAPGEAEQIIQQHHSEALLHVHGICNDPDCTDESHDHSGVSCTDGSCTNSTHHHDEHH